jgi:hypothetical protein
VTVPVPQICTVSALTSTPPEMLSVPCPPAAVDVPPMERELADRAECAPSTVPAHLGVETLRQWSDLAILRTTPALLGLFSLITVWAGELVRDNARALRPSAGAWYEKNEPTCSDAIAAVRRALWTPPNFSMSRQPDETITIPAKLLNRVLQALCLAA